MGVSKLSPQGALDVAPLIPPRGRSRTQIRHFNGTSRRTSDWDGLRRDTQLWFENEDCLVYFYGYQASQRGASLRIPLTAVKNLKSAVLMDRCLRKADKSKSVPHRYGSSDRRYLHLRNDYLPERSTYELYIPAPSGCTREEAFSYHLTTRNLFAYSMGFPLVGERLSSALVNLWQRLHEWKVPVQLPEFMVYLEKQGYMDFTESAEHSLACLQLAETGRLRSMWIESFVHCVGMQSRLDTSPEFSGLSKTASALILRAALEMDLHITRVVKAVGMFLENELSAAFIGLSRPTRDHLDLFRSFLHSFYVNRFGYFPPRMTTPWNRRPWTSMHQDFQNLYDYLADKESSPDRSSHRSANGGFCVIQNVQSFDKQHGYAPLPHPLPLLPQQTFNREPSAKGLRGLSNLRRHSSGRSSISSNITVEMATNPLSAETTRSPLVQEYRRFERGLASSKNQLDRVEARKVRWLLVYGVLQMLNSVTRAPAEVRDSETPSYPLCALTTGGPSWVADAVVEKTAQPLSTRQASNEKYLSVPSSGELRKKSSKVSVRPDCEADSAEEFFTSRNVSRQNSFRSQTSAATMPLKRNGAIRSSVHSLVGSFTKGHSHRMSLPVQSKTERLGLSSSTTCLPEKVVTPPPRNPIRDFDFGFNPRRAAPITEDQLFEDDSSPNSPFDSMPSPSAESDSSESSQHSSGRSSYVADELTSPATEYSSWGGDSSRSNSISSNSSFHVKPLSTKRKSTVQPNKPVEEMHSYFPLSDGAYVPKGFPSSPGKKSHLKRPSVETTASSVYPEENVQAADIDEFPTRGRQRFRGLSNLSNYGIVLGEGNVW